MIAIAYIALCIAKEATQQQWLLVNLNVNNFFFLHGVKLSLIQLRKPDPLRHLLKRKENEIYLQMDKVMMIAEYPTKFADFSYQRHLWTSKQICRIRNIQECVIKHIVALCDAAGDSFDIVCEIRNTCSGAVINIAMVFNSKENFEKLFVVTSIDSLNVFKMDTLQTYDILKRTVAAKREAADRILRQCVTNAALWNSVAALNLF